MNCIRIAHLFDIYACFRSRLTPGADRLIDLQCVADHGQRLALTRRRVSWWICSTFPITAGTWLLSGNTSADRSAECTSSRRLSGADRLIDLQYVAEHGQRLVLARRRVSWWICSMLPITAGARCLPGADRLIDLQYVAARCQDPRRHAWQLCAFQILMFPCNI